MASLEASLAALPQQLVEARAGEVPTAPQGAAATTILAPVVHVDASRITLDARQVTLEQLLEDLGTLERNWGLLHPGVAAPQRVGLVSRETSR